jgi:hypothetical protein
LGIQKTPFHFVPKPDFVGQKSSHFGGRTSLLTRPAMISLGILETFRFVIPAVTHLDWISSQSNIKYTRNDRIVRRENRGKPLAVVTAVGLARWE